MKAFDCFAVSEQGPDLDGNDDFVLMEPDEGIFIVADGMGGRPGGAQASRLAARAFLEQVRALDAPGRLDARRLQEAVAFANDKVRAVGESNPMMAGMGTTLSAAILTEGVGKIVHVGDSRIYRFGDGGLEQLTEDHTLAAELVARNHLSKEGVKRYPLRHVLSRCLGPEATVEPDILDLALRGGDWLLLVTDGLLEALPQERLAEIMAGARSADAETMCRALMRAALTEPPSDNVTAAVVRLVGDDPVRASGSGDGDVKA